MPAPGMRPQVANQTAERGEEMPALSGVFRDAQAGATEESGMKNRMYGRAGRRRSGLAESMGLHGRRRPLPENIRVKGLQPMSDLDLKIANGWGDVEQDQIPDDWRTFTRIQHEAREALRQRSIA